MKRDILFFIMCFERTNYWMKIFILEIDYIFMIFVQIFSKLRNLYKDNINRSGNFVYLIDIDKYIILCKIYARLK